MPPGPVFNWACVASSAADILIRAARIRAAQLAREGAVLENAAAANTGMREADAYASGARSAAQTQGSVGHPSATGRVVEGRQRERAMSPPIHRESSSNPFVAPVFEASDASAEVERAPEAVSAESTPTVLHVLEETPPSVSKLTFKEYEVSSLPRLESAPEAVPEAQNVADTPVEPLEGDDLPVITRQLQASKVPSSRIGRLFHYGGLAASLGYGAASELIRRNTTAKSDETEQQSLMLTEANITRLVSKLSQMRGAALKLGQFLSIQDTHVLPAQVDAIFRRVQDSANYMPDWQMEQVMQQALGPSWLSDNFDTFERIPFAAASIGQVHTATLSATTSPTGTPARVAVKIQFPNIANSITSDLGYVSMLLTAGRMLPKGLFLDRTMKVMKEELADECDYAREADSLRKFAAHLVGDEARFRVPWVWERSTERVLVMERVDGVSVGDASILALSQDDRNEIASRIIELCLLELFSFQLMQTDPNYSNFLWDARTRRLSLIDFGATRAYGRDFMDGWLRLLQAAAAGDRDACVEESKKIGYLTGEENDVMLAAHTDSLILLATPFAPRSVTTQPFAFGPGTPWAAATQRIREYIPVMIQNRLTPPPRETYSLNRKLSGAFLLSSRLGARVDTRAIWEKVVGGYKFQPQAGRSKVEVEVEGEK
uniref:Atypical/ABC1/ABC1-A protein kinase n=1 Tax=Mycena chlorophos TaxID=658473 RepID=A0ABQ0L100_MYCCL|nr:atypical/ABC1/ABC1-A protein kinase [Mycena chlorophos]